MYYYTGKVIIVTGGTSGIGEASAIRFAQEGAEVVITGRNKDKGKALTEKITNFFLRGRGKVIFHELDVKNDTSIEKFKDFLNNNYEKVDVLFNNAGVFPVTPKIEKIDRDSLTDIFDTNIVSLFMLTKAVLPLIKKARGVIINNASVAGLDGNTSGQSYAYAASKAGVIKFTKMMAKQYGEQFRTNCICPGIIETPIYNTFNEEKFKERIPMKRCGKPDDVAKIVVFLGSDEAN